MPLITPPETVTVDTGHLYTVVVTVRAAHHRDSDEFHPEVVHAANGLRQSLIIPRTLEQTTVTVPAEELWWLVFGAEGYGCDHNLSPVSVFFVAVDALAFVLETQAPRTERGMFALMEAECLVETAAIQGDQP